MYFSFVAYFLLNFGKFKAEYSLYVEQTFTLAPTILFYPLRKTYDYMLCIWPRVKETIISMCMQKQTNKTQKFSYNHDI